MLMMLIILRILANIFYDSSFLFFFFFTRKWVFVLINKNYHAKVFRNNVFFFFFSYSHGLMSIRCCILALELKWMFNENCRCFDGWLITCWPNLLKVKMWFDEMPTETRLKPISVTSIWNLTIRILNLVFVPRMFLMASQNDRFPPTILPIHFFFPQKIMCVAWPKNAFRNYLRECRCEYTKRWVLCWQVSYRRWTHP